MKLRYIFLLIILAIITIFFLNGFLPRATPPGLELNISENISPYVKVFILDNDRNIATSIDMDQGFFFQQKGLPEGTEYGFRIIDENGNIAMPVYVTFIAKDKDWIEPNRYYHNLRPSEYIIELLTIKDGNGIIVAKTNLSVFNLWARQAEFEKKITDKCNALMVEPIVDVDGWSRDGKLARCVASVGIELKNSDVCDLVFKLFNATNSDECFTEYAIIAKDALVCDNTGMPKSRGFCKAKVTKDWTECQKVTCDISCYMEALETQQDLCIQWYAIETRNADLCNEIKSEAYNMKTICLNIITKK